MINRPHGSSPTGDFAAVSGCQYSPNPPPLADGDDLEELTGSQPIAEKNAAKGANAWVVGENS